MNLTDIEIARNAKLKPIFDIASSININSDQIEPYGHSKAKLSPSFIDGLKDKPDGKLILVTAMSPTPAGEGKTTTTVGLGDALNRVGKKTLMCLREPSLGPCFGMKGGAAGGGYAQVVPMEDINLHFTGDFHAITATHNLLSALIDNHIFWGNKLKIDTRRITWRRVLDMNDRSLRDIVSAMGGVPNGYPRQTGFDITVASEIMAILCLSNNLDDLERRIANIIIGRSKNKDVIRASDLKAAGAMTVLLKDALSPNLVQTLENNPAFVHGGPFANIAHGCNSVVATKTALKLSDYVVTEAGFGADLGAEKFFDIKCRKAGLKPSAAVIVATIRALKMHGGVKKSNLKEENLNALKDGLENLGRHIKNVKSFGVPVAVAINHFVADTENEINLVKQYCQSEHDVEAITSKHWALGGEGAEELAHKVISLVESGKADFQPLYPDSMPLLEKMRTIVQKIYHGKDVSVDKTIVKRLEGFEKQGFGHFPICMAKTQYSFSANPNTLGAPSGHVVPIREVRLSAGAEFIVAICGEIMTMPGLPGKPAAVDICLDKNGQIEGLF